MVNIWQVYFDEQSKKNCYRWTRRYNNAGRLTEFFENSVIAELIENKKHLGEGFPDYFGVWSHDIKFDAIYKEVYRGVKTPFTEDNFYKVIRSYNADGYALHQKKRKNPNIVFQADRS